MVSLIHLQQLGLAIRWRNCQHSSHCLPPRLPQLLSGPSAVTPSQALWGDWCFLPKEKRVVRGSKARSGASGRSAPRTMFEQFALEPIWRAYSVCEGEGLQVRPH